MYTVYTLFTNFVNQNIEENYQNGELWQISDFKVTCNLFLKLAQQTIAGFTGLTT